MTLSKKNIFLITFFISMVVFFVSDRLIFDHINFQKEKCEQYSLLNTSTICLSRDKIKKTPYLQTRIRIQTIIQAYKDEGYIENASVYFRDLMHGPVFGVNEVDHFAPASLLKLPLSFVFLNSAEENPKILSKKLRYDNAISSLEQIIFPKESAKMGLEYTVEDLLKMMISYSDNISYEMLESFIKNDPNRETLRIEIFQELGLIDPKDRVEDSITTRGYASLFTILFNASYLSLESSQKLLYWLSLSDYNRGLVGGIPKGLTVSHKFGERYISLDKKQLHDCGIIYYPENPYLLCVMAKGADFRKMEEFISEISSVIYKEVDSRKI